MHERPTFVLIAALATCLPACGSQVDTAESAESGNAETQTGGSDSGATLPASSGSTAPDIPDPTSADASTSTSAADSTSGGETTDPPTVACDCFTQEGPFTYPACDVEELCEPIVVSCDRPEPSDCALDELTVLDPSTVGCHLDAIIEGHQGMLRWELPYPQDAGAAGQRGWVVLQGDGSALFWHESWGATNYAFSAVEGALLDPDATLADCGDFDTAEPTFLCLYRPTTEDVVTCSEAYDFPIG